MPPKVVSKINVNKADYDISATYMKSTNVGSYGSGDPTDVSRPVFFNEIGQPTACSFSINYGKLSERPTTASEGDIYFVIEDEPQEPEEPEYS